MKKEYVLWTSIGCAMATLLWFSFQFQGSQEAYVKTTRAEFSSLQQEVVELQDHFDFISTHEKELDFLNSKGWFTAHNRLIAGEFLDRIGNSLSELHFTFEPETTLTLSDKYHFRVTKMTVEASALFDIPFYDFLENLLTTFPGVLRLLEFSLTRGEGVSIEPPPFMGGKLVLEWMTMGDSPNDG
jgi:hypothetical protein